MTFTSRMRVEENKETEVVKGVIIHMPNETAFLRFVNNGEMTIKFCN